MYNLTHIIITCLLLNLPAGAQQVYGNEWIDEQQVYFKIPVAETGFYQLNRQDLTNAGIAADHIPASAFQIFKDGNEIAIEVSETGVSPLSADGYIRFFGEKNDGRRDTSLYVTPGAMPHPFYNLYADTTFYYLTWKTDGATGRRIQPGTYEDALDTVSFHREEILQLFSSHYLPGQFYPEGSHFADGSVLTDYDAGEGWTGPEIKEGETYRITFRLRDFVREDFKGELEIMLAGWVTGTHSFMVYIQKGAQVFRKLADVHFQNFDTYKAAFTLKRSDLSGGDSLKVAIIPIGAGGHISVSYAKLSYLQESHFETERNQKLFHFDASDVIWKCSNAGNTTFYDITTPDRIKQLQTRSGLIPANKVRDMIGVRQYLPALNIQSVYFPQTDLKSAAYLIITHPTLRNPVDGTDPVNAYANYRATAQGGGYKPAVIDIDLVYDQFNYGQRGPQGIRNLIAWLSAQGNLKFIFIIGKSIDPQKARKLRNPSEVDMVPNAGWPGSDVALMPDWNNAATASGIAIGRLGATYPHQVRDYLQKVKVLESQPNSAEWRKRIVHLSGGRSRQELAVFKGYVKGFEKILAGSELGANIETISKESDDPVERIPLYRQINRGAALITLFGHSAPDVTDIDIGYASDEKSGYENHPYYPAVIINGCAAGSIFYSDKTLSGDWIFSPKNGAILFLAHTFNGVSGALKRYTGIFYEVLADPLFSSQAFGTIQREAIRRNMQRNPDIFDRTTVQQMTLHGDPAVRIFPAQLPDFALDPTFVKLSAQATAGDPLFLKLIVKNQGRNLKLAPQLTFRRFDKRKELIYSQTIDCGIISVADTVLLPVLDDPRNSDSDLFEFIIDEQQLIHEENEANNRLTLKFSDIRQSYPDPGLVAPLLVVHVDGRLLANGEQINRAAFLQISIIDTDAIEPRTDTSGIYIWLKAVCDGCAERRIFMGSGELYSEGSAHFVIRTHLPGNLPAGKYLLTIRARDTEGNYAPDYQIEFILGSEAGVHLSEAYPNPASHSFSFPIQIKGPAAPGLATITICDVSGKIVHVIREKLNIGNNEFFWRPENHPAGIYSYKIELSGPTILFCAETTGKDSGRLLWFP